jgi:hypothetical protein
MIGKMRYWQTLHLITCSCSAAACRREASTGGEELLKGRSMEKDRDLGWNLTRISLRPQTDLPLSLSLFPSTFSFCNAVNLLQFKSPLRYASEMRVSIVHACLILCTSHSCWSVERARAPARDCHGHNSHGKTSTRNNHRQLQQSHTTCFSHVFLHTWITDSKILIDMSARKKKVGEDHDFHRFTAATRFNSYARSEPNHSLRPSSCIMG